MNEEAERIPVDELSLPRLTDNLATEKVLKLEAEAKAGVCATEALARDGANPNYAERDYWLEVADRTQERIDTLQHLIHKKQESYAA